MAPVSRSTNGGSMVRIVGLVGAGALLWLGTQAIAFGISKAGDGWIGPTAWSLPLVALYPIALVRLGRSRFGGTKADAAMLMMAVTLDVLLAYNIERQEPGYFAMAWDVAPSLVFAWLALWIGWQIIALATLIRAVFRGAAELPNVS